jgi:hypothetical protein
MPSAVIADLLARGVRLDAAEAVAVAQLLIARLTGSVDLGDPPDTLLGPPSPANVLLGHDGSVTCLGCQVKPAVFEIAVLLHSLLPTGPGQVPGGLRYAIARGLHDVEALPFDSIEEFSQALARFERGDRAAIVRGILARAIGGQTPVHAFGRRGPGVVPSIERRRTAPAAAVLRRQLHDADKQLYEQRVLRLQNPAAPADPAPVVVPSLVVAPTPRSGRWYLPAAAAVFFAAIALAGVADLVHFRAAQSVVPAATVTPAEPHVAAAAPAIAVGAAVGKRVDTPGAVRDDAVTRQLSSESGRGPAAEPVRAARVTARQSPATSEGTLVRALDDQRRPVFSPAFASSGTAMFFHTGGSRDARSALAMSTAPEGGGDLQVMTIVDDGARNYHAQPSPDGRFIAFDSDRDGERGVYIARQDGSNVRRISGPGYAALPTWAPDGRRVAYVRAESGNPKVWNLWLQGVDEGEPQRLTHYRYGQPWNASWFPDNRRVSYTHEDKIVVLDVDSGRSREFDSPIKGRLVRTPAVSPDGTKVIFQVYRQGAWILDVASGAMACVLVDPTAEEFAWSPDGRRVAFHSRRDGQWGIYILHRS